ncbi:E3 ubiquitin-protein ligase MSL2 [Nymphon striatum]|nr:E3 ubiquitin-protein ligase MSL2 [Nymphon striatum]
MHPSTHTHYSCSSVHFFFVHVTTIIMAIYYVQYISFIIYFLIIMLVMILHHHYHLISYSSRLITGIIIKKYLLSTNLYNEVNQLKAKLSLESPSRMSPDMYWLCQLSFFSIKLYLTSVHISTVQHKLKMNAVNLYVSVFQAILNVEITATEDLESASWNEIQKLLMNLKDELCCFACKHLNSNVLSSSPCCHLFCDSCVNILDDDEMGCKDCPPNKTLRSDKEAKSLILCCIKMCEYTVNTKAYKSLNINGCKYGVSEILECFINSGSNNSVQQGQVHKNRNVSETGESPDNHNANHVEIATDSYNNQESVANQKDSVKSVSSEPNTNDEKVHVRKEAIVDNGRCKEVSSGSDSDDFLNSNYRKLSPKKSVKARTLSGKSQLKITNDKKSGYIKLESSSKKPSRPSKLKPAGCRCGLATPYPGKLTCCGQRCPCYSNGKACKICKCRGCRNPQNRSLRSGSPRSGDEQQQTLNLSTSPNLNHYFASTMKTISYISSTDEEINVTDIDK